MYRILLLAILVYISGALLFLGWSMRVSSICLTYGYPDAKVDYRLHGYCVKRVDQTDLVIPLDQM